MQNKRVANEKIYISVANVNSKVQWIYDQYLGAELNSYYYKQFKLKKSRKIFKCYM